MGVCLGNVDLQGTYLPTATSLYYYIFRVCYSILDIYHAFKYKVVCHVLLIYDEDLSGYRFLVVGVHGFVFEECRLARHFCLLLLLSTIYLQKTL